jgi:nucleotide-binding universal stress UspA family protein
MVFDYKMIKKPKNHIIMKKKIVQFIRSAENLEKVVANSEGLARALDMEIKLLMVLETRHPYFYPMTTTLHTGMETYQFEELHAEREKEAEQVLKKFIEEKNMMEGQPRISYEILSGATDMILIDASEDKDTFLILINESQEPEQGFLINTYLNILEKTGCPILKIPEEKDFSTISKILYATDYKEEDLSTLAKLADIAVPFKAEITTLHITDSVDLEEKMLSHGFEKTLHDKVGYDKISFAVKEDENVVEGIMDYARSGKFDLIVLLKENRNFLQRLFTRSDSNKILSESDVPVMVFHEEE